MPKLISSGPACQSCGSPMATPRDHAGGREDNPYCALCGDARGALRSYAEVHKNMAEQRFMKVNGMPRKGAEDAATRALAQMPAWRDRAAER